MSQKIVDKREKTKGERENHRRGVGKEGNKKEIRGVEKWRQQGRGEGKSGEKRRMQRGPKAIHRVSCQDDKWKLIHPSSSSSFHPSLQPPTQSSSLL